MPSAPNTLSSYIERNKKEWMSVVNKKINVTQSLLPNRKRFHTYIDQILDSGWLTNRGQSVQKLESKLEEYLGIKNVVLVNNGTTGLQVAYKALGLTGEIITSPFTFIATASSAKWEGLNIVFADINPNTLNVDINKIEQNITDKTSALVPVHVFGNPCDGEAIDKIARKYNLKVIYDAAHAFGVRFKGKSVLNWGDISLLSFHATKLFHTIEGGALIINDDDLCEKARKMINFGITGPESIECLGINAKMNEFQAAMGLCLLDDMEAAIIQRGKLIALYDSFLKGKVERQLWHEAASNNFSYYPVIFDSEIVMKEVQAALNAENIFPRRYFYPSLDTLGFLGEYKPMPVSQDIASRVLCLPLSTVLSEMDIQRISQIILKVLER